MHLAAHVIQTDHIRMADWSPKDDFWFKVKFVYCGHDAQQVSVCGDFNGWNPDAHEMERSLEGFSIILLLSEGFYQYKFVVDGTWTKDEHNPHTSYEHDNSVMFVHMDPKVYGLRPLSPPFREYQRLHSDGNQFQILSPNVTPETASFGIVQRQIYVYLPPSYQSDLSRRYPVVYAHDGQNLFSTPADKGGPPSGGWYLDAKLDDWWNRGDLPEFILVGVPNSDSVCAGNRCREYCTAEYMDTSSDPFIRYIIDDVKGAIDSRFRTLPDKANTFTLGASAGGLVSYVLAMNHSQTFSCALCLSPYLSYVDRLDHTSFDVARASGWPRCRLWVDSGDGEEDALYEVGMMKETLEECGWVEGGDFVCWVDECRGRVEKGITHTESVWRERVYRAFKFALCEQ